MFGNSIKNIISNKNGVSIIMLVIAVAMIAIVASFAVYYAQNTTPEAKMASGYASLKVVKDACDNAVTLIELNPNEYYEEYFFGKNVHEKYNDLAQLNELAVNCGLSSSLDFSQRTYEIKPPETSEEEVIIKNLELKSIQDTYIVDLEKDKYYVLKGIEFMDGNIIYEYRDVVSAYQILVGDLNNLVPSGSGD